MGNALNRVWQRQLPPTAGAATRRVTLRLTRRGSEASQGCRSRRSSAGSWDRGHKRARDGAEVVCHLHWALWWRGDRAHSVACPVRTQVAELAEQVTAHWRAQILAAAATSTATGASPGPPAADAASPAAGEGAALRGKARAMLSDALRDHVRVVAAAAGAAGAPVQTRAQLEEMARALEVAVDAHSSLLAAASGVGGGSKAEDTSKHRQVRASGLLQISWRCKSPMCQVSTGRGQRHLPSPLRAFRVRARNPPLRCSPQHLSAHWLPAPSSRAGVPAACAGAGAGAAPGGRGGSPPAARGRDGRAGGGHGVAGAGFRRRAETGARFCAGARGCGDAQLAGCDQCARAAPACVRLGLQAAEVARRRAEAELRWEQAVGGSVGQGTFVTEEVRRVGTLLCSGSGEDSPRLRAGVRCSPPLCTCAGQVRELRVQQGDGAHRHVWRDVRPGARGDPKVHVPGLRAHVEERRLSV